MLRWGVASYLHIICNPTMCSIIIKTFHTKLYGHSLRKVKKVSKEGENKNSKQLMSVKNWYKLQQSYFTLLVLTESEKVSKAKENKNSEKLISVKNWYSNPISLCLSSYILVWIIIWKVKTIWKSIRFWNTVHSFSNPFHPGLWKLISKTSVKSSGMTLSCSMSEQGTSNLFSFMDM